MADFMKILQQAQKMQGRFQKLQEELQQQTVTAASGGGMVTVEANGQGTIKTIKIDPSVVNSSDVEMLEAPGNWTEDRAAADLSPPEAAARTEPATRLGAPDALGEGSPLRALLQSHGRGAVRDLSRSATRR